MLDLQELPNSVGKNSPKIAYFKVQKWQLSNISTVKFSEIIEFFLFFKISSIYLKQLFHS